MLLPVEKDSGKPDRYWYWRWCLGIYSEAILDRLRQLKKSGE